MPTRGWPALIPDESYLRGEGAAPIPAYSEFLPPPRVGWKPYGDRQPDPALFAPDDPFGWQVDEFEEAVEIRPGLEQVGRQVLSHLARMVAGGHPGFPKPDLADNPYWPPELAAAGTLPHERLVVLLPLALSKTQDDKGRVRWTLFGGSEQGPGRAFWKGFYSAPRKGLPATDGIGFFGRLLAAVYGEKAEDAAGLKKAGFRFLPDDDPPCDFWAEDPPAWIDEFRLAERGSLAGVKYLLTFRPFARLPAAVRAAYLGGRLRLLPFPGSLVYWGVPGYHRLREELPLALQIPLLLGVCLAIGKRVSS